MADGISSNTATNSKNKPRGKPFAKGDTRINRHGRPKNHDELRALIQRVAGESMENKPEWTRIEVMIRQMLISHSPADRVQLLEHGFGKVPQDVNVNFQKMTDAELLAFIAERTGTASGGIG